MHPVNWTKLTERARWLKNWYASTSFVTSLSADGKMSLTHGRRRRLLVARVNDDEDDGRLRICRGRKTTISNVFFFFSRDLRTMLNALKKNPFLCSAAYITHRLSCLFAHLTPPPTLYSYAIFLWSWRIHLPYVSDRVWKSCVVPHLRQFCQFTQPFQSLTETQSKMPCLIPRFHR